MGGTDIRCLYDGLRILNEEHPAYHRGGGREGREEGAIIVYGLFYE